MKKKSKACFKATQTFTKKKTKQKQVPGNELLLLLTKKNHTHILKSIYEGFIPSRVKQSGSNTNRHKYTIYIQEIDLSKVKEPWPFVV